MQCNIIKENVHKVDRIWKLPCGLLTNNLMKQHLNVDMLIKLLHTKVCQTQLITIKITIYISESQPPHDWSNSIRPHPAEPETLQGASLSITRTTETLPRCSRATLVLVARTQPTHRADNFYLTIFMQPINEFLSTLILPTRTFALMVLNVTHNREAFKQSYSLIVIVRNFCQGKQWYLLIIELEHDQVTARTLWILHFCASIMNLNQVKVFPSFIRLPCKRTLTMFVGVVALRYQHYTTPTKIEFRDQGIIIRKG